MIVAKDNPFNVRRVHALGYQPQGLSWEDIDRQLEVLRFTAAIVGPHGSGKTTLLEHLAERLTEKGTAVKKLFISEDVKVPWKTIRQTALSIREGGVLLFDGACHLPWWRWQQVKRLARRQKIGLIVTCHGEGMLPTLVRCETSPVLLSQLVGQLTSNRRPVEEKKLIDLYHTHHGNLRNCLRQLYDEYAMHTI